MLIEQLPSIFDVAPLEQGGPIARKGFLYQDHVAARSCIRMLQDQHLEEVWCETLDDITLLWREGPDITAEFVQVKAAELQQMWSVALICDDHDKSLVGHSLAQHRCSERCKFRVVSRVGVNAELKVLTYGMGAPERCMGRAEVCSLHQKVGKQLDGVHSLAGWSPSNWLEHTYWDVAESDAAIEYSNLLTLETWLETIGEPLFSDQRQELYTHILARVMKASALLHHKHEQKKFKRLAFRAWILSEIQRIKGHAPSKAGKNLVYKMEQALIPNSTIENALLLRLQYRRRMLDPKYQQEEAYKTAELELTARLNHLVAELDTGIATSSGKIFHVSCLSAVAHVQGKYADVELSFLQGAMYSMTDRCRHRFLPAALP
jgi:hypothetical protein